MEARQGAAMGAWGHGRVSDSSVTESLHISAESRAASGGTSPSSEEPPGLIRLHVSRLKTASLLLEQRFLGDTYW